jgi:hypothetical protein
MRCGFLRSCFFQDFGWRLEASLVFRSSFASVADFQTFSNSQRSMMGQVHTRYGVVTVFLQIPSCSIFIYEYHTKAAGPT